MIEAPEDDGWSASAREVFARLGLDVSATRTRGSFGRIHGPEYDPATRVWTGAADPDRECAAVAPSVDRRR